MSGKDNFFILSGIVSEHEVKHFISDLNQSETIVGYRISFHHDKLGKKKIVVKIPQRLFEKAKREFNQGVLTPWAEEFSIC